jgi:hypothetical protein
MLKFSKIISSKSKNIVKENSEYLGTFQFVELNVSNIPEIKPWFMIIQLTSPNVTNIPLKQNLC